MICGERRCFSSEREASVGTGAPACPSRTQLGLTRGNRCETSSYRETFTFDRRMKCIGKRKGDQYSLSYVAHQRGPEAGNAGAAGMADARVDNSGRAAIEQGPRGLLGGTIAAG